MSAHARILLITVYVLVGLGVVMIYSATFISAAESYGNPYHFLVRQAIYVFLGTCALFFAASVPAAMWKYHARALILLSIVLLLLLFLPVLGHSAGGARRWLRFGFFNFQPVEFAKVAICLYLADYLTRKRKIINQGDIKIFLPPLILIGGVCALILLQPDLGSCVFIFCLVSLLFFWVGIRMRYALMSLGFFLPLFYFLVIRVPYRLSRVTAYLNPWEDPQGSGFQMIQSFLAYGVGGIHGVGLGKSIQKLYYLPSSHNDFIFSIIGEELGLIGVLGVLALFGLIFVTGIRMVERAKQDYDRLVIMSLILMITLQGLIHMLVATGLIPTKGLPLPFVSYGGTSLFFNLAAVGIILGISRQKHRRREF